MRILHLADLHLGKSINGLSMIESQHHILFNQVIKLCEEQGIKHIIISGDVYDHNVPSEDAVNLLSDFLSAAVLEKHIKVYMISGNHDSRDRLSCFNGILEKQGLYIDCDLKDDLKMYKHEINEDGVKVNIYSLPYIYPSQIREISGDADVKDYQSSISKILGNNIVNKDEINILNTHYFVTSDKLPIISDSETRKEVGTIEQVSYKIFDDFDYVALGHLHCPQSIGRDTVRYAGSPLRYSVSEIKQHKTFTIINIKDKDDIQIEQIPILPKYEFVEIEGTVDELTIDSHIKDYRIGYFKLLDNTYVLNAANRLKAKYPHYVDMYYANINDDINGDISLKKVEGFNNLPPEQQFFEFFKFVSGKKLDDIQKQAVESAVKETFKKGE